MFQVKSKRMTLDLQVRPSLGERPEDETDLQANSTPLEDEDLAEVAAYGKTRSCGFTRGDA